MAQSGNGTSATTSTGTTNQLGQPVRELWCINRGATEIRARVEWEGSLGANHPAGHAAAGGVPLKANEDFVFKHHNGRKIKGFYVSTGSGTSSVDWSVRVP